MKRFFHNKIVVLLAMVSFFTLTSAAQIWNPQHQVGITSGQYHYSLSQTPGSIVELTDAGVPNTGITYQWEQSLEPINGFAPISGATQSTYTFSSTLTQTTYYRRKNIKTGLDPFYSNVVKVSIVSVNWEDLNYIRTHEVHTKGPTTWAQVDNLTIGDKFQTTTYLDGLGRHVQTVDRETATSEQTLWGDLVQFSQYDVYGRQPQRFLPYSTTTESGKFKTTNQASQAQYYSSVYNETSAFSTIVFDNSPADRVLNVKKPGTSWAASSGNSATYDVNTAADDVQIFTVDYQQGGAPIHQGAFAANKLYKISYADENGKLVVEFVNGEGQVILKKVQLDNTINHPYNGWICTYNIYDDFGQLRIQIQPEGVNYLVANGWSFTTGNGPLVLSDQCFFYSYDSKGRNIWKKSPGAEPLTMLYDARDRVVFMQDGNQASAATPQWTTNLYDELDRPVISCLYNTSATLFTLNLSIAAAPLNTDVTVNNVGTFSVSAKLSLSPLGETVLNNTTVTTILSYQFYDHYGNNSVKTFNNGYNNSEAYGAGLNVMPIAHTQRVTSMVTGDMKRVLNSTTFLSSTYYYDERGSQIQSLSDNIKGATDITTLQYHFDGRLLSACSDHSTPNTGYTNYKILTKFNHDKLGRVVSIAKKFGSNSFNTLSEYTYDDMGRLSKRKLDPGYTGNGGTELEVLDYSYNLHSQITGINKDYALKSGNYDKWSHFFGLYLGYDNRDNQFTAANLNGQVTGAIWNTQGDDEQRKYDYTYDNAGRLTESVFKERHTPTDTWSNALMDFSVGGNTGKITYDLNGNLLNMLHKGVVPGNVTPIIVDDLSYGYSTLSNKLITVTDLMSMTDVNGKFGDFNDGANGSNPDYIYDNNGNIVIDLNKNAKELEFVTGANGILYNFLDKP